MSHSALAGLLVAAALLGPGERLGHAATADPAASGASLDDTAPARTEPGADSADPAERIRRSLAPPLDELVAEALARNPDLARTRAAAAAAEARAPQVRSLPDPMASLTAFLLPPETRVGPQRVALSVSQRLPWFGELGLREREALLRAAAAREEVTAKRLALVTEVRRLVHELVFLDAQERALSADRETVAHFEELARARYAAGVGLEQAVVKLQAEITKDDARLLEIAARRAGLTTALNALRDRPPETRLPEAPPPETARPEAPSEEPAVDVEALEVESLGRRARHDRPELARARALIAAAETAAELARTEYRPDFTLGLGYTAVDRRSDAAGRAVPPEGNGDDVVGLSVGVNLPVWRARLAAGVEEASARQSAAEEELRSTVAGIDQALGELAARIPLVRRQLELFDRLLSVQAEEALRSAEAAYAAGTLGALDLLDAERVLLDVRIATARTRADYRIAIARLEGAVGGPLEVPPGETP